MRRQLFGAKGSQAGGAVPSTILPGWPLWPVVGIYPTLETVLLQGALILLAVVAAIVLLVRSRRAAPGEPREVAVPTSAVVPDAGHMMHVENPEGFAAAVRPFLEALR